MISQYTHSPTPWVALENPGPHQEIDPETNTTGQEDALVQYNFKKEVHDSNENVNAAVISGFNL